MKARAIWLSLGCSSLFVAGMIAVACSSGSSGSSANGMATATVSLSDPATCSGANGPFAHVYVTVTDVEANISATAGDSDSGWKDLTPGLASQPRQIDLLGQANNQCFLATLGDATELQAGNYQQIRLLLASNSASFTGNACSTAGAANCVVLSADNSIHALQLSSESKTGLKIPSGQIASGGFNIAAGQTRDLNIDFNTCCSIVKEGNGQFRLKPVLHAGEVSTTSTSINGTVLDSATGKPVSGTVLVALEQKDSAGIDRINMATLANTDGSFVFCPLPAGTWDIVIVGESGAGLAYGPSIITGVSTGDTTGSVNLYAAASSTQNAASFSGTVTSQNSSNAGTIADLQMTALETPSNGGSTFTIPLLPTAQQTSAALTLETAASTSCPTGTDCVSYQMTLPAAGPYLGAYASAGASLTQSAALASYVIDAQTFVPSSGGTPDCNPSEEKSQTYALTAGGSLNITVQNALAFGACQ